jgi:hypothetical protein
VITPTQRDETQRGFTATGTPRASRARFVMGSLASTSRQTVPKSLAVVTIRVHEPILNRHPLVWIDRVSIGKTSVIHVECHAGTGREFAYRLGHAPRRELARALRREGL